MTSQPNTAFVTMVRDDHKFLRIWVEYYARHVPRTHLFILLDGLDQVLPDFAAGCQSVILPQLSPGPGWDMRRWELLADFNKALLCRFDVVVLNDVDEIIVADPASGTDLMRAIGRACDVGVVSPFAVEVVHRTDFQPASIELAKPILRQRPHVRVNEIYAKPCISAVPVRWNLGGHRSDFPTLNLDPCLFLFHLRFMDRDMLLDRQRTRLAIMKSSRQGQAIVAGSGWAKSLEEIDGFLLSLQAAGAPIESDFTFGPSRRRIRAGWSRDEPTGLWRVGRVYERHRTYLVPERFRDLL